MKNLATAILAGLIAGFFTVLVLVPSEIPGNATGGACETSAIGGNQSKLLGAETTQTVSGQNLSQPGPKVNPL